MPTIHRATQLSCLYLAVALLGNAALGEDTRGYVLAPLRTEFQRSEISSKASAILIVDASVSQDGSVENILAIRSPELKADLRKLSASASGQLLIRLQFTGDKKPTKSSLVRLKEQLKELANKSGYPESQISEQWTSSEWESGSGSLGTGLMDDPGEENLIINKILVAAPLHTRISKLHGGLCDAHIKLRAPIDARNLQLSDATKDAIRAAVGSMKLSSKGRLHFSVSSTKAGTEVVDKLFSDRQPPAIPDDAPQVLKEFLLKERENFVKSPALTLAQELGFQNVGYSHSSNGGAPELLLESQAPAFELKSLDGNAIKWPEWRKGKPALITFWGVACGPCRLEAPHLSRLHEKYGDQIAIIGINAYEETEETILDYVTKEKLKHQIVVGGGQVATSSYNVASFPTTFWINRRGEVVRYAIGFDDGQQLEAELIEFLKVP